MTLPHSYIAQGWECPRCRHIYSPAISQCFYCPNKGAWMSDCTCGIQFFELRPGGGTCKKCGKAYKDFQNEVE